MKLQGITNSWPAAVVWAHQHAIDTGERMRVRYDPPSWGWAIVSTRVPLAGEPCS